MKHIIRLDEEDLRKLVMEHFDAKPSEVTSTFVDDVDENNNPSPTFYIEVERANG